MVRFARTLEKAAVECGVNFIGGYSALVQKGFSAGCRELIDSIPEALAVTEHVCSSVNIGSTKAAILSLIETPASLFLAWLILGETLSVIQLVGAVVIVASVLVITLKGKDAA